MASSSSTLIPLYDDLLGWFDVNSVCLFWPPGQRRATLIRKPLTSETGGKSYFHNVGIIRSYFLIILILVSPHKMPTLNLPTWWWAIFLTWSFWGMFCIYTVIPTWFLSVYNCHLVWIILLLYDCQPHIYHLLSATCMIATVIFNVTVIMSWHETFLTISVYRNRRIWIIFPLFQSVQMFVAYVNSFLQKAKLVSKNILFCKNCMSKARIIFLSLQG